MSPRLLLALAASLSTGCTIGAAPAEAVDAGPPPPTCPAPPVTRCPSPAPRYAEVQAIFQARCVSCHLGKGPSDPWPLDTWQNVADWSDLIRADVQRCAMPPPDAGALSDPDAHTVLAWIACGVPQ